jgi:alpha-ketoglutarate-dependent taurine dioxygenase
MKKKDGAMNGQRYSGVICRPLHQSERRVRTQETQTPLVFEPSDSPSGAFLHEFLAAHSPQIIEDISTHGAILLRGFEVDGVGDFERQVLSIRGMRGMNEVLLSERGRTVVEGTRFVLHTNTLYKTGGTLGIGNFHTENYFTPDVPRYISFLCLRPSKLGGETGLLNMAGVYADLPDSLKRRLEEQACFADVHPVPEMATRYGLCVETTEAFCATAGLPIQNIQGKNFVVINKPSVIEHPLTHERALVVNLVNVKGVRQAVIAALWEDYSGPQWIVHRFYWKNPWLPVLAYLTSHPVVALGLLKGALQRRFGRPRAAAPPPGPGPRDLNSLFGKEDIESLTTSLRRRYSSFLWKRGDILIVDNLKMAHSGMAGFGARELRALICNPIALPRAKDACGLYVAPLQEETPDTLGAQIDLLKQTITLTDGAPDFQSGAPRMNRV